MRKLILMIIVIYSIALQAQVGAFRITSGAAMQIGYNNYRYLTFGTSTGTTNNGAWAIEHWNGGLNFWKPAPTEFAGNYKLFISDLGAVGINMLPYSRRMYGADVLKYKLQVDGRIVCNVISFWSDQSLKKDITNLDTSLQKILSLRPVSYHFKPGIKLGDSTSISIDSMSLDSVKYATCVNDKIALDTDQTLHYGFIAQEIKTVFPNLVADIGNLEAVNYVELIPVLVKSIQQQQKLIQDLRDEVTILKNDTLDYGSTTSKLFQNTPNPFTNTTTIGYYIDENTTVTSAKIEVRDLFGALKSSITLTDITGLGQVTFQAGNLIDRYYVYSLIINNATIDTKLMLISHS